MAGSSRRSARTPAGCASSTSCRSRRRCTSTRRIIRGPCSRPRRRCAPGSRPARSTAVTGDDDRGRTTATRSRSTSIDPNSAIDRRDVQRALADEAAWQSRARGREHHGHRRARSDARLHDPLRRRPATSADAHRPQLEDAKLWAARVEPMTHHYDTTWGALQRRSPGRLRRRRHDVIPMRSSIWSALYVAQRNPERRVRVDHRRAARGLLVRPADHDRARARSGCCSRGRSSARSSATCCRRGRDDTRPRGRTDKLARSPGEPSARCRCRAVR